MKAIKIIITILALNALFCSCTCEQLITRAQNKCGTIKRIDTVTTTLTTTLTTRDTLFAYTRHEQRDTIVIQKNNLIYKYFYNTKDSTVYLEGKCNPEIITVKQPYTYNEIVFSVWRSYKKYFIFFFFCVALYYVIRIINNITKPKF